MDSVQQHIDNMFQDLPETKEIERIKNDLYLNAMDRYQELMDLGKTESETLGTIIIEMGDRDVLLEEFGYNQEEDLKDYSLNTMEDAKNFIETNAEEGNKIGLGILMILIGGGLVPTFNTFNAAEIGVVLLLILVALAVGLFVTSGLKLESIEKKMHDVDKIFYMTEEDYEVVEEQFSIFEEKERYRIPIGIMLCILAVIPILIFSFLNNEFLLVRYGILLLMTTIGVGVFQFVKYGMTYSAYEKVLNIGEYSVDERRFQQKIEPIAGIYWLVITLLYFIWSFVTMYWDYTWIIWPIAGVLWAIVVMILKFIDDRDDR